MCAEVPPGLDVLPSLLAVFRDAFVDLVMLKSGHATPPIGLARHVDHATNVNHGRVTYDAMMRRHSPAQ